MEDSTPVPLAKWLIVNLIRLARHFRFSSDGMKFQILEKKWLTVLLQVGLHYYLYKDAGASANIALAEVFWGKAFLSFEDAIEIGDIIETTIISDFSNRLGSVDQ